MSDIKQVDSSLIEQLKHGADAGSLTITIGVLTEVLPVFAAFLSIIWMTIRIYETRTVQGLLGKTVKHDDRDED